MHIQDHPSFAAQSRSLCIEFFSHLMLHIHLLSSSILMLLRSCSYLEKSFTCCFRYIFFAALSDKRMNFCSNQLCTMWNSSLPLNNADFENTTQFCLGCHGFRKDPGESKKNSIIKFFIKSLQIFCRLSYPDEKWALKVKSLYDQWWLVI